ncbi:MAG: 4-hydroxy-tetrahydrodipicolinate reductase [Porticoccaceae bacterium]|nr:4-hydroxy-tetrahydrodipicolinate reductase [Porticoccaceae bacterium]MDG1474246.1 4-hydroxy-tetrahydrodipicolinate reductase [Porticoccaceae bacterium]
MLSIAITGAAGRMGKTLVEVIANTPGVQLSAAIERPGSDFIGHAVGYSSGVDRNAVQIVDNIVDVVDRFDILIDFSNPESTVQNATVCAAHGKHMVVGTTGLSSSQIERVMLASKKSAICMASNFATGVNLCFKLAEIAASVLGDDVDIEISETHHRHKKDAPSGTALSLGKSIAGALGRDFNNVAQYGVPREGSQRDDAAIVFSSLRAGDVIGDHTVLFAAEGERIEITHKASNRAAFARGAVRAAKWLSDRGTGMFDMQDVLNLR